MTRDIAEQDSLEGHSSETELKQATNVLNAHGHYDLALAVTEAADTLGQMRDVLLRVHDKWLECKAGDLSSDEALDEIFDIIAPALTTTKIEKDAQPAVECKMPNCSDEAVWMGLCQHHREWAQGR